jgi:hypothetical protein
MSTRNILLASFIPSERLEWYYGFMEGKYNMKVKDIFKYKQLEDPEVFIMTFRFTIDDQHKLNFKELFPNALLIHKRGNALYTINGLNLLIDYENPNLIGNLEHHDIRIDWSDYQNKLIMVDDGNLVINDIERMF